MLSETGVPARLWRAPVPEKRRLSERVYSAMSSRIVSIWGFCLPRARGIASPSPAKPCPGNTDGVVASGHRRIDETSVCRGRQPICGRRSAQSPVAPDKLLLRTIACRAARVVQAVGCPGWVKLRSVSAQLGSSALPSTMGIVSQTCQVRKVPTSEVSNLIRSLYRRTRSGQLQGVQRRGFFRSRWQTCHEASVVALAVDFALVVLGGALV
jgi:hypothetical protein